jgi:hypothetical protein
MFDVSAKVLLVPMRYRGGDRKYRVPCRMLVFVTAIDPAYKVTCRHMRDQNT